MLLMFFIPLENVQILNMEIYRYQLMDIEGGRSHFLIDTLTVT